MRSENDVVNEVLLRSTKILHIKNILRKTVVNISASAIFGVSLICIAAMPRADTGSAIIAKSPYGSLVFAGENIGGYIFVGIIALVLGFIITMLCIRFSQKNKASKNNQDKNKKAID